MTLCICILYGLTLFQVKVQPDDGLLVGRYAVHDLIPNKLCLVVFVTTSLPYCNQSQ
jgi:hypothetical protein